MKGSTKKPANQGSAGSANVQPPRMPNAAKISKAKRWSNNVIKPAKWNTRFRKVILKPEQVFKLLINFKY
jgi:hypothetical protein